jgi:hypothetical protein
MSVIRLNQKFFKVEVDVEFPGSQDYGIGQKPKRVTEIPALKTGKDRHQTPLSSSIS